MKRLQRSQTDRMLAGVCAGVAHYFNVDPTLVRILTVLLSFILTPFSIIAAYVVLAIIMPNEGDA